MTHPKAIFPGTFDPITNGHLDVVRRASALFGGLVVAVAAVTGKKTLFSLDERVGLARASLEGLEGVQVMPFDGLLVNFARSQGASVIVRGIRGAGDADYEVSMAAANRALSGLETVFIAPSPEVSFISSTLVRSAASAGADVSGFVPAQVARALIPHNKV